MGKSTEFGLVPILASLFLSLAPAGLAAQGSFEGVVTMVATSDDERHEHTVSIKGSMWRTDTNIGGERNAIIRTGDGRFITVSEAERMYMVIQIPPLDESDALEFVSLGRRETVAGHVCEYYQIRDPVGELDGDEVCITTALGFVGFGPSGLLGDTNEQAIRKQFRDGFMILKGTSERGATKYEVTRIERKSLSDSLFAPPEGFQEIRMPGFGRPR